MPFSLEKSLRDRGFLLIDLAREMGVDKSTVTRWCSRRVPAERVLRIERITGIPRHQMRPDLYRVEVAA